MHNCQPIYNSLGHGWLETAHLSLTFNPSSPLNFWRFPHKVRRPFVCVRQRIQLTIPSSTGWRFFMDGCNRAIISSGSGSRSPFCSSHNSTFFSLAWGHRSALDACQWLYSSRTDTNPQNIVTKAASASNMASTDSGTGVVGERSLAAASSFAKKNNRCSPFAKTPAWMTLIDAQELGTPLQTTWLRRLDYWPHSAVGSSAVRRGLVFLHFRESGGSPKQLWAVTGKQHSVNRLPFVHRVSSQKKGESVCCWSPRERWCCAHPHRGQGKSPNAFLLCFLN